MSLGTRIIMLIMLPNCTYPGHLVSFILFYSGQAIVSAVTSGSKRFFLGTDSAPHDRRNKECSCGCAGIYNSPVALSLYAKVFEEVTLHFTNVHLGRFQKGGFISIQLEYAEFVRIMKICDWKQIYIFCGLQNK